MLAPTTMPTRVLGAGGDVAAGAAVPVVIAGRDMVELADAGEGEAATAGRDIVDDAAALEGAAAAAAARIPVVDAGEAAAAAERIPVDVSDPGDADLGAALGTGAPARVASAAAEAIPAPVGDTSVVPHCTQNFAPG